MIRKEDLYKKIPNHGAPFSEGGATFYWNLCQATIGKTIQRVGLFCKTEFPPGVAPEDPRAPYLATFTWIATATDVTAVASRIIDGKLATKWKHGPNHEKELTIVKGSSSNLPPSLPSFRDVCERGCAKCTND